MFDKGLEPICDILVAAGARKDVLHAVRQIDVGGGPRSGPELALATLGAALPPGAWKLLEKLPINNGDMSLAYEFAVPTGLTVFNPSGWLEVSTKIPKISFARSEGLEI